MPVPGPVSGSQASPALQQGARGTRWSSLHGLGKRFYRTPISGTHLYSLRAQGERRLRRTIGTAMSSSRKYLVANYSILDAMLHPAASMTITEGKDGTATSTMLVSV